MDLRCRCSFTSLSEIVIRLVFLSAPLPNLREGINLTWLLIEHLLRAGGEWKRSERRQTERGNHSAARLVQKAFRWLRQKADTRHRESASPLRHHGKKKTQFLLIFKPRLFCGDDCSSLTCSMSHSLEHAIFKESKNISSYQVLTSEDVILGFRKHWLTFYTILWHLDQTINQ